MPFDLFAEPTIFVGFATLIVLEVVLGIDNLVFIAILADKLPPHQRDRARLLGLSLALVMRLILLASISWIVSLTHPVLSLGGFDLSWRDIILAGGGIFLLIKATKEIHERLEGESHATGNTALQVGFWVVIAQILALDAVFSLDSIITAVGMVDELWVMMTAVIVAMALMIAASKPLTAFVGRHPTVIILCLAFLLLIGCSLVAEGFGFHFPKGYLYAAIGFSVLIEGFNQIGSRNRRRALARVPLRQRTADTIFRLLTPSRDEPARLSEVTAGEAIEAGEAFQASERTMIQGVIELADKPVRAIMTPRPDLFWLDADEPLASNRRRLIESGRTRVLVGRGSLDSLLGVIETKTALPAMLEGEEADLVALADRPLVVPDQITALRLIDVMRETGERFAVVTDRHGNIDGVVTATDIFAAIAGDLAEDEREPSIVPGEQGAVDADGNATIDEVARALGRKSLGDSRRYSTLAGYLLFELGRMPDVGEVIERDGLRFVIAAASQNRIERVRISAFSAE